ncbi:MAG: hypothetical protein GY859_04370 [Desulfobacterales bacterium]|nr:hypothetical protein [Desulfobacterales bacterium]
MRLQPELSFARALIRSGGRGRLLGVGGVLPNHIVHFRHRLVHPVDPPGLLAGRGRDLPNQLAAVPVLSDTTE